MQKGSEVSTGVPKNLQQRYAILFEGELYNALPSGKLDKLTAVMNQTIKPKKDKKTYERWFKYPLEIPAADQEEVLTVMLDALVEVAEDMKNGMAAKALKLREQAERVEERAKTVEKEIIKVKEGIHYGA